MSDLSTLIAVCEKVERSKFPAMIDPVAVLPVVRKAATALEAQAKEIEALRHEIRALQGDVECHTAVGIELSGENTALKARAETAERERVAEWNLRREAEGDRDVAKAVSDTLRRERDEARAAEPTDAQIDAAADAMKQRRRDEIERGLVRATYEEMARRALRAARAITGED